MDAVAACLRADIDDRVADAGGFAEENFVFREDAQGKSVNERIAVVARLENALTADGGYAKTVAVVSDATDDPPIVKMSRRMPPTPVAAPWNGSIKLG